jgi:hypothetical protein
MKAANLRWTQVWRRNHKKSKVESIAKKKGKRTVHIKRAVGGMSLDDLKKKQSQKPEVRQAARDAALRYAITINYFHPFAFNRPSSSNRCNFSCFKNSFYSVTIESGLLILCVFQ